MGGYQFMITTIDNVIDNMPIKYFDTIEYVRRSAEIKDPAALAEYQVKQMESAIETAVQYVSARDTKNNQELATKGDLFTVEAALKNDIIFFRNELHNDITSVRNELKGDITSVRNELKSDVSSVRHELYNVRNELKSDIMAVKTELKSDIKDLRYDTLKFVIWTGIAVIVALGGMISHGFHWV